MTVAKCIIFLKPRRVRQQRCHFHNKGNNAARHLILYRRVRGLYHSLFVATITSDTTPYEYTGTAKARSLSPLVRPRDKNCTHTVGFTSLAKTNILLKNPISARICSPMRCEMSLRSSENGMFIFMPSSDIFAVKLKISGNS